MSAPIFAVAEWLREPAQTDTEALRRLAALERFATTVVNARAMTTKATDLRGHVDNALDALAKHVEG